LATTFKKLGHRIIFLGKNWEKKGRRINCLFNLLSKKDPNPVNDRYPEYTAGISRMMRTTQSSMPRMSQTDETIMSRMMPTETSMMLQMKTCQKQRRWFHEKNSLHHGHDWC
jgi:hypothetical protein